MAVGLALAAAIISGNVLYLESTWVISRNGELATCMTGVRSFCMSIGRLLDGRCDDQVIDLTHHDVVAFVVARAASTRPIVPPAPALFSTTTVHPVDFASSVATSRDEMSVPPPGGNGTIRRIGLVG